MKQFSGMKETYLALKKHSDQMTDWDNTDYNVRLDMGKTTLNEVTDRAMRQVKEQILPLQKMEGDNVKLRREKFLQDVKAFRFEFINALPYHESRSSPDIINGAYEKISEYYVKTQEFEKRRQHLADEETLFDLERSIYKELRECESELKLLKRMWDLIALIDLQFDSWRSTLWDQIDTDLLMTLIKDMQTK